MKIGLTEVQSLVPLCCFGGFRRQVLYVHDGACICRGGLECIEL